MDMAWQVGHELHFRSSAKTWRSDQSLADTRKTISHVLILLLPQFSVIGRTLIAILTMSTYCYCTCATIATYYGGYGMS